jgi:hypothetical protein
MTNDDLQLLRELRAGIAIPDEETRRRIYARATRPHRIWLRPRRLTRPARPMVMVAIGLIAAAALGFGVSTLVQGSSHQPSEPAPVRPGALQPGITTLGNDNPFGADGKLVTLQQFVADNVNQGYSVPLPDSPLANSDNVGNVWEATTGEVIVYYPSSGIELNYGGTGVDYTGVPADQIQTINGVRAIVEPAGTEGFPFATVMLPLPSGHLVSLYSKGPVSDLVSVAKTMPINGSAPLSGTSTQGIAAEPLQFSPINLDFTRAGEGIKSIAVTINAPTLGGTALLQVVRNARADISYGNLAGGQVVLQEQVPMTNIASPKSGPPGTQALSTWSGTLATSAWDGGCERRKYVMTVKVSPANPTPEARGEWAESGWFVCG